MVPGGRGHLRGQEEEEEGGGRCGSGPQERGGEFQKGSVGGARRVEIRGELNAFHENARKQYLQQ